MIHRVSLALFSLLLFLGPGDRSLSAQEREDALRLGPVELRGDGPSYAEAGFGGFNVLDMDDGGASAAGQIQLRWGRKLYFIGPAIGLMGNTDGGGFVTAASTPTSPSATSYSRRCSAPVAMPKATAAISAACSSSAPLSGSPMSSTTARASACAWRTSPTPASMTTIRAKRNCTSRLHCRFHDVPGTPREASAFPWRNLPTVRSV